ncbi:MAG: DUF4294 domain-containing protein [Bacteroidales bacterium]|nr:DUF4294 domain-containing protein [Bacteroidales bacterium]
MKKIVIAILLVMATTQGFSQLITKRVGSSRIVNQETTNGNAIPDKDHINVVYGQINGNDTLLIVYLPEVDIDLMNRYYELTGTRRGRRLVSNVRKVYPYAKLAGDKMKEYDLMLADISSNSERRRMMKEAEKEISDQYTEELKKLTFSQGAILIRLIDRETGNTSYQVVQELRGRLRAFFYQGFARLWGYNLKTEYNPQANPEDDEIETIITLLERGQI